MYFIGDEEIEALKNLFDKKRLYRYQGAYQSECDAFEAEFSKFTSSPHSLLLSSGTNALVLALLAGGLQPGDEVIIPAYTFVATAAAVIHAGGIPVIANIDKNLSLDFEDAKLKLSDKTRALILVHMDGLVADIAGAKDFCRNHSLLFIEDVAQAIGASYNGKFCGTYGDFGCFSLNENKNISCGEGGILVTANRNAYEKAFCLHDGPAQFNPTKKEFFTEIQTFMGLSMRVSEIQGAIMRVQLKRLDGILKNLRERKNILVSKLQGLSSVDYVAGYSDGECASSLHLQFKDPEKGAHYGKLLRDEGFSFAPVTARPAHAAWKWNHLLGDRASLQPTINPYRRTEKKYVYPVIDFLQSIEILTKTHKMEIDIFASLDETRQRAEKIRAVLSK